MGNLTTRFQRIDWQSAVFIFLSMLLVTDSYLGSSRAENMVTLTYTWSHRAEEQPLFSLIGLLVLRIKIVVFRFFLGIGEEREAERPKVQPSSYFL